jgi:hypothetical protein
MPHKYRRINTGIVLYRTVLYTGYYTTSYLLERVAVLYYIPHVYCYIISLICGAPPAYGLRCRHNAGAIRIVLYKAQ